MVNYLTPEGLEKLKKELAELKTTKRQEIAERLEQAKALGDLSENAEYEEAKEEQSMVETHIAELEDVLRSVVVIQKSTQTDHVTIGSTIRISSENGEETYTIVGSEEADPLNGKISNESPLGSAFLEKKVGETVEVRTPGGSTAYTIEEIQ